MKKKVFSILLVLVLLVTVLAGCGGGGQAKTAEPGAEAPAPKVIKLKLAHQWPANNFVETNLVARWIKEVEEKTGGRVQITSYPGETLCKSAETYEGVVQGIADIGVCVYSYTAGRFPTVEAFMTPGVTNFLNAASASYALIELINTQNPKELQDTKHLFSFSTGPNVLMTKKPVRTLEDIKGLALGSTQAERTKALQLLGATPVALPTPEWYEACSKGLINGGIMSPEALQGHRLYEVTGDYLVNTPLFSNSMFYCVMNKNVWNSLPPDIQKVFAEVPEYFTTAWDTKVKEAVEFSRKHKSVEIINLTPEETERWKSKLSSMKEAKIKSLNERGLNGEEIFKYIEELEKKYNAKYPHSQL